VLSVNGKGPMFFVHAPVSSAYGPPFLRVQKKLRPWQVSSSGWRIRENEGSGASTAAILKLPTQIISATSFPEYFFGA